MRWFQDKKRKARNAAGHAQGFGGCYRCGDTWDWKPSHSTQYSDSSACFPLCEECWQALPIVDRVPYYRRLWDEWVTQGALIRDTETRDEYLATLTSTKLQTILDAVGQGL